MRIYFADTNPNWHLIVNHVCHDLGLPHNLLWSYHYIRLGNQSGWKKFWANYKVKPNIFIDSGAYSARSLGVEIDVAEYADWCIKHQDVINVIANLDIIYDYKETEKNQRYLEGRGLDILPVWHGGEPWGVLQDLIDEYEYIALGGLVSSESTINSDKTWKMLVKAFQMRNEQTKYHGFGVTSLKNIQTFPWHTVDSSSWGAAFRYGIVNLWNPSQKKLIRLKLRDKKAWRKHKFLLNSWGFDWRDFVDRDRYDTNKCARLSAYSWRLLAEHIETNWEAHHASS